MPVPVPPQPPAPPPATGKQAVRPGRRWFWLAVVAALLVWQCHEWWPVIARGQARRALAALRFDDAGFWLDAADWNLRRDGATTLLRARWKRRQGDTEAARKYLVQAYAQGAPRRDVEREEWMALAQLGQMREAEPHLPELLRDPGDDVMEICEAYASGFVHLRRYGDAIKLLDAWLLDEPKNAYAHLLRGRVYHDRSQTRSAESDFQSAIELNPGYTEARIALAGIFQQTNRPELALSQFEKCLDDPRYVGAARIGQAIAWRMLGKRDQAADVLRKVLADTPDSAEASYQLGLLELEAGNSLQAVKLLNVAVASQPAISEYHYGLAQALQASGQTEEAESHLQRTQRLADLRIRAQVVADHAETNPRNIQARLELGQISFELGRSEEAIAWLKSVLDLAPNHAEAHRALANHYRSRAAESRQLRDLAELHESFLRNSTPDSRAEPGGGQEKK